MRGEAMGVDRSEVARALAKALAFKACGEQAKAEYLRAVRGSMPRHWKAGAERGPSPEAIAAYYADLREQSPINPGEGHH